MKVVVIGAGIIGTTSAVRIKRQYPESELSIVASQFSPDTTSDIAAGWWVLHLSHINEPSRRGDSVIE